MMKLTQYSKILDSYVADIQGADWKGKVVWHDTNAAAYRKDSWTLSQGFPQTNIKIAIFNVNATRWFQALGFPIIPSFAMTLPLVISTRDPAHCLYQVLQKSTVQVLLGLLCPSP